MSYPNRIPKNEHYINAQGQNIANNQILVPVNNTMNSQSNGVPLVNQKEEEKIPVFLIKLWNIVEDPSYQHIIHWDESGYSFHIVDPYSFCRNVLPHYYKHNNLNSLIRQLNMYGFRKMSPLDKSGLTRSESDQDHLEFSHSCFIRDRPDLLMNIKRKQSTRAADSAAISSQTQNNVQLVMDELRQLRDKQRNMDQKINDMSKENKSLWNELDHVRQQHGRQQQIVRKLVQFLVAMVQPNISKRVMKRGVLAIDEPPNKRPRTNQPGNCQLTEILDRLQQELMDNGANGLFTEQNSEGYSPNSRGPIIAEVTDEFGAYLDPHNIDDINFNNSQYSANSQMNNGYQSTPRQPRVFAKKRPSPQKNPYNMNSQRVSNIPQNLQQHSASQPSSSNQITPVNPSYSPLNLSPSLDRQISQELQLGLSSLQDYISGMDTNIDHCRDLLGNQGVWDFDADLFNNLDDDNSSSPPPAQAVGNYHPQLALEQGPSGGDNLLMVQSPLNPSPMIGGGLRVEKTEVGSPMYAAQTPELLTPINSPFR